MRRLQRFTRSWFGREVFPSPEAARRAWPMYRRAAWAVTSRMCVPRAATVFDGLTIDSRQLASDTWKHVTYPLAEVLDLLADDRANLTAFRAHDPRGAHTIADFLELLEADFQMVETTARALAALTGPSYRRPYPQHLGSARTYSATPETA